MEFSLSKELVYAMLGSGATIAGSYSLGILKKLSDKIVIEKLRSLFDNEGHSSSSSCSWGSGLVSCNFTTRLIKSLHGKTVKNRI